MSVALFRSGEDVSSFVIGQFADQRLAKIGGLFFKRLLEKLTLSVLNHWQKIEQLNLHSAGF